MSKKVFFIPLFASFLFFVVYLLLAQTGNFLSVEPGYSIDDVSRWCERISGGYFREPSNALSNIGFITTGLIMFWILSREPKGKSRFHGASPTAIIFATAALFLGPGSLLMHGTHTAWGQWADWLSMIMFNSIPWLVNIFVIKDKMNIQPKFVIPSTFPDELLHSINPVWEKLYAYLIVIIASSNKVKILSLLNSNDPR